MRFIQLLLLLSLFSIRCYWQELYFIWGYASAQSPSDDEGTSAKIKLFEDFSGEIVNGTKHFSFKWSPSGNEALIFENGKIYFSNMTLLLS